MTTEFDASAWLRDNPGACVEARSNIEEYTSIDVIVRERGHADRKGTAWDVDTAVGRAVGKVK